MSYRVTRKIDFCYGHRLLDYEGKCAHLHGHNAVVEITFAAEKLDERGMVFDFVDMKKLVKSWIDEELDHRLLLRSDDPLLPLLREHGEPCYEMKVNPTAENIAKSIYAEPQVLWAVIPLVLFWQCRLWLSTARGYMHDDPIVYAAKDWVSWLTFALFIAIFGVATIGVPELWSR